MDRSIIAKLNREVTRKFPEMRGIQPSVRRGPEQKEGALRFTLTYKGTAELPTGRKIRRIVRIVADERGNILRLSTSK